MVSYPIYFERGWSSYKAGAFHSPNQYCCTLDLQKISFYYMDRVDFTSYSTKKKNATSNNFIWFYNLRTSLYVYYYKWFVCWVGFYGISTIVGYLIPNPFLCKSVLFKTIQFSISTQFNGQNISISNYSSSCM